MFNQEGDPSRIGSSEFADGSAWGDQSNGGRSISAISDNNQERSRYFVENYEVIEPISLGAHSINLKVRSKLSN